MNILSIDFDFFQNIPYDVLSKYPDGIDLPQEVSNLVWASRLCCYESDFRRVCFDNDNFKLLLTILQKQHSNIPVLITGSHLSAYYYICDLLCEHKCTKTDLTNIDLHHDIFNDNKIIDCGNWIGNLLKEKKIGEFEWIAKPLSQQMYGLSDDDMRGFHALLDLSILQTAKFDAVFICKSNPWVLPDFDPYFAELVKLCKDHFSTLEIETVVEKIRVLPEIQAERKNR